MEFKIEVKDANGNAMADPELIFAAIKNMGLYTKDGQLIQPLCTPMPNYPQFEDLEEEPYDDSDDEDEQYMDFEFPKKDPDESIRNGNSNTSNS